MNSENIVFGQHVKDIITGFDGFVTGKCNYITGCDQALVTPTLDQKTKAYCEPKWFDVDRLVPGNQKTISLPRQTSVGADLSAPIK